MPDAGRVIAGSASGLHLLAPGPGTRPLADRVKQTLFAILEPDLAGASILDLFAGSGAAGIECLSRGAARAVFVERDPAAVRVIRENLRRTGFAAGAPTPATVVQADVLAWLRGGAADHGPYDIVIVDPPYAETDLLVATLAALGDPGSGLLAPGARVVAKQFWRDAAPAQMGLLASERSRRFGETVLTFYRYPVRPAGEASRGES
jgi:16S rRNA (guanine966-N2)-methyltransferase